MTTAIYNNFSDVYGNNYSFNDYMSFSQFWFDLSFRTKIDRFSPVLLKKLQYAAANSKEARAKI